MILQFPIGLSFSPPLRPKTEEYGIS